MILDDLGGPSGITSPSEKEARGSESEQQDMT